ncbi:hypothetical protein BDB00DRAFT_789295 [Zychaea mexicana]|uniref:uncharacterized protein n=1 Tax=Zychaea mexicana TaxID=64656 RepID=UPI0022FDC399|nr:uncharacterized protein BDB00DRAFT_789295 [Zychaea mexicana]KAI9491821.1 hypothetical protein BDB00DRAFT_789295 [Zychaea mexicana]
MAIACLCPTLRYLNISHCYFSGELQNSERLEPDFQQGRLLQMEHMDMGTCRLDKIDISGVYRISIHSFIWILCRCPNLKNLRAYASAVTLSAFLRACFIYCPDMSVIKYSPARETAVITHPTINQRGILLRGRDLYNMNASKLVSLVLHGTVINKPLMEFVIDQCYQTIESLQLSNNWMLQNDTLYYLAQRRPPRLRSLVLSSCANFQADALVCLIRACPHIQSFRLSRATAGVTDESLYQILDALPDLQYLNVAHCPRLSIDALQFLKDQAKVRRIHIVI